VFLEKKPTSLKKEYTVSFLRVEMGDVASSHWRKIQPRRYRILCVPPESGVHLEDYSLSYHKTPTKAVKTCKYI